MPFILVNSKLYGVEKTGTLLKDNVDLYFFFLPQFSCNSERLGMALAAASALLTNVSEYPLSLNLWAILLASI